MNQPRKQDRDSLFLLANLRLADSTDTQRIKVRNLSPGGMMAESPVRTACGERLTVELRNLGWISGTVAWVADSRFGVIFDREVDCKAVRQPVTVSAESSQIGARPLAGTHGSVARPEPGIVRRIC